MDFRDLSYVLAIAQHQNITRAAEALYVSQPTLSKFLKSLEEELGLKLFRKLGNKYMLTYAGERYIERAGQILQIKKDLDMELADIIKRDVGVLKVAFPTMRCAYMLPSILPPFQQIYPNVKVQISEGHSQDLDGHILRGEAEIAFYTQPAGNSNPALEYEVLGEEELLICAPKNHPAGRFAEPNPASRYPRLDPALFRNERIIMMLPTQRTGQIVNDYLHRHGLQFENVIYTSNMSAIIELVGTGYGIAFIFEPHLRHYPVSKPVDCYSFGEPRMVSNFVAATRKGGYLPVYARDFVELARKLYWRV